MFLLNNNPVAAFSAASVLQVSPCRSAGCDSCTLTAIKPGGCAKNRPRLNRRPPKEKREAEGSRPSRQIWSFEEDETLLEAYLEGWTLPELAELMQRSSHSVERRIQKLSHEPTGEDLFDEDSTDLNGESGLLDDTYDGGWDEMVAHGHKLAAYMLRDRAKSKSFDALS